MKSWQAIWKGRNPWPTAIIGYFVVFISFLIGFVAFASRQKVDLVQKDYYAEEILFRNRSNARNGPNHFMGGFSSNTTQPPEASPLPYRPSMYRMAFQAS